MKTVNVLLLFSLFLSTKEIRGQIYNGQEAVIGQFKYIAAVYTRDNLYSTDGSLCGGAIIAPNFVLTAAHCLDEKVAAIIFLGSCDRDDAEASYKISHVHFILHPEYTNERNDIALIRIPATCECDNIAYARMPQPASNSLAGEKAIIMGWGQIGDGGVVPSRLSWSEVKVITNEECRTKFDGIEESDICVGTQPPLGAPCWGDSGGPLVLRDTGELIGIASTGPSSCEAGLPAVFARVSSFMPWITTATGITF